MNIVLSHHLSDDFFRKVLANTNALNAQGANLRPEHFLGVWLGESRIQPWSKNVLGFGGLNGLNSRYLANMGFGGTFEEFLALPADKQVDIVNRYYTSYGPNVLPHLRNETALYVLNFLPKYVSHSAEPDFVLAPRPEDPHDFYDANTALDVNHDGQITVSDLTAWLEARKAQELNYWNEVKARMLEIAPESKAGRSWLALLGAALGAAGIVFAGKVVYDESIPKNKRSRK